MTGLERDSISLVFGEGRATGEDTLVVGPLVGFLGTALGLAGRVAQSEDDLKQEQVSELVETVLKDDNLREQVIITTSWQEKILPVARGCGSFPQ